MRKWTGNKIFMGLMLLLVLAWAGGVLAQAIPGKLSVGANKEPQATQVLITPSSTNTGLVVKAAVGAVRPLVAVTNQTGFAYLTVSTSGVVTIAGDLAVGGNIAGSGTISPGSPLGQVSIASLVCSTTSDFTGDMTARAALNVSGAFTANTTATVGGVSTFSQIANFRAGLASLGAGNFAGAFSANTTMTVGGVTTCSQAVNVRGTLNALGAAAISGALTANTTVTVGGESLFSQLVTAEQGVTVNGALLTSTAGATISGAALTAEATAPVSTVTLTVSGSQRWVRTELAASSATTSTATVADIQGGWLTLGEFQNLTLPTATTATCAGLDIFISGGTCGTGWVIIPLGDGGAGASRDTVELNNYEVLNLYCDGAQFWIRSTTGTVD